MRLLLLLMSESRSWWIAFYFPSPFPHQTNLRASLSSRILCAFGCKHSDVQVQDTRLRMPNKWHICKEGKAGNEKRQLLVFSELPSLPSAGSRPGCFHTSLGCEPRSLIRVSLGCSIIQKKVRKDNPNPAYSPVSDRRRLTALVEVHWARRVQAPMPRISGPNLQGNHIIETCKEEGCAVSTQETVARRK
jgi:hypothetical protein